MAALSPTTPGSSASRGSLAACDIPMEKCFMKNRTRVGGERRGSWKVTGQRLLISDLSFGQGAAPKEKPDRGMNCPGLREERERGIRVKEDGVGGSSPETCSGRCQARFSPFLGPLLCQPLLSIKVCRLHISVSSTFCANGVCLLSD